MSIHVKFIVNPNTHNMSERKAKRQRLSPKSPVGKALVIQKPLNPRAILLRRHVVANVLSSPTYWALIAEWLELDDVYGLVQAMDQSPIFKGLLSAAEIGAAMRTVHIPYVLDQKQRHDMNDWLMARMDKSFKRNTPVRALTMTNVSYSGGAKRFKDFWTAAWINSLFKIELQVSLSHNNEAVFDALAMLNQALTSAAQLRQLRIINLWDIDDEEIEGIDNTDKAVSAFQQFLGSGPALSHLTSLDLVLFPNEQEELEAPLPDNMESKRFPALTDLRLMCSWTKQDVTKLLTEFKSLTSLNLDRWDEEDAFNGSELINLIVKSQIKRLHLEMGAKVHVHLDKTGENKQLTIAKPLFNTEWTTLVKLLGEADKWSLVKIKLAQDQDNLDEPVNMDTFFTVATAVFHQTKMTIDDLVIEAVPDEKSQIKNWIALAHHTKTCTIDTDQNKFTYRYWDQELEFSVSEAKLEPGLESWMRQTNSWTIRSMIIRINSGLVQRSPQQCVEIVNGRLDLFDKLIFAQLHKFEIDVPGHNVIELKDMDLFKRFSGPIQLSHLRMDHVIVPKLPALPWKQFIEFGMIIDEPFGLDQFHAPRAETIGLTILDRKNQGKSITTRHANDFLARHPKLKRLVRVTTASFDCVCDQGVGFGSVTSESKPARVQGTIGTIIHDIGVCHCLQHRFRKRQCIVCPWKTRLATPHMDVARAQTTTGLGPRKRTMATRSGRDRTLSISCDASTHGLAVGTGSKLGQVHGSGFSSRQLVASSPKITQCSLRVHGMAVTSGRQATGDFCPRNQKTMDLVQRSASRPGIHKRGHDGLSEYQDSALLVLVGHAPRTGKRRTQDYLFQ